MAVRNEKVVLSLEDHFTTPMAKAAAATALTSRELKKLDGQTTSTRQSTEGLEKSTEGLGDTTEKTTRKTRALTIEQAVAAEKANRLRRSLQDQARALVDQEQGIERVTDAIDRQDAVVTRTQRSIDRYSGRLRLITEAVTVLGPGLVPLGAASLPVLSAMAVGLAGVAGAAGTALLAFNGMGDALEAIDEYQLSPTTENLHAMQDALSELGPAGADFAQFLNSLGPTIDELQNVAREGLFPGLQEGIENLLPLLPQVEQIVSNIATSLGRLGDDAGAALAGGRFAEFFDYLERDAAPTMEAFARSTGNLAEGLANLLVAFGPLTSDFTGGLERMTRSFADWSASLSKTDGFRNFVAYIEESGPQAVEFLGAIGSAFAAIIRAAAPFGQAVLPALTALAEVLAAIANSPVGPPLFTAAAGFLAVSRAATVASAGVARFNAAAATTGGLGLGVAGKIAGIAAAFGILGNELAKLNGSKVDLSKLDADLNAIADGGGADALDHITNSLEMLGDKLPDAYEVPTLGGLFGDTPRDNAAEWIESVDRALASLVESGNAEKAAKIFAAIQAKRTGRDANTTQFAPFGQSAEEFDAYASALAAASAANDGYAASNSRAAESARASRAEIRGLVAAMEEQSSAALSAFDATTQYAQALMDARKQAEKSNAGIKLTNDLSREQRAEVIANRTELSALAAAWNNQSKSVTNNVGKWREARRNFIQTATAMGATAKEAKRLADRFLEIPKSVLVDVEADTDGANRNLNVLYARLAELNGSKVTTYIDVVTRSFGAKQASIPLPGESADGGTVPKTGMAYADRHHYLLADGEEVISNRYGQADRHRSLLKAINAGRLADGGTAGPLRPLDDRLAIAQAMQQIRDLTRDLNARVKKGKHKGDLVTTGIDRRVLELQLAAARRDLKSAETREQREKEAKQNERTMDRYRAALGKELDRETAARDRLSEAVDKNMGEVDRLTGLYDNLAGTIRSGLDANQFEPMAGNAWDVGKERMPSIDEIIGRLQGSTADAGAFMRGELAISQHLSGAALESVLSQGLDAVSMFAELSPEQLQAYQLAFDQNEMAKAWAGAVGGGTVYGRDLGRAEQIAEASQAELVRQTALMEAVQARIDRAANDNAKALKVATEYLADMVGEQQKLTGGAKTGARNRRGKS